MSTHANRACMTRIERRNVRRAEKEREKRSLTHTNGQETLVASRIAYHHRFLLIHRVSCPGDSVSLDDFGISSRPATNPITNVLANSIIERENSFPFLSSENMIIVAQDSLSPLLEEEGVECVSNESRMKKEEKEKKGLRSHNSHARKYIIIHHKTVYRSISTDPPSPPLPIIRTTDGSSISSEVGDPIPFDDGFNAHRR